MANRDENLQKINAELEMMSDEELEKVSGGAFKQTSDDSEFLYKHKLMDKSYGLIGVSFNWSSASWAVDRGWAKAGITCVTKWGVVEDNLYFVGSKQISREEAYKIVEEKFPETRPLDKRY